MGYLAEPYLKRFNVLKYTRLPDRQKEWIMQLSQVLFHTKYQAKWWKGPFFAHSQDSKQDTIGKSAKAAEA